MNMYSQARACGVDPDGDSDREYDEREKFRYTCNACSALESFYQYRANHVCPWCGEGVMELEES